MPWDESELAYLRRTYRHYGHHHCARALGKKPATVWAMARKQGLGFADLPGYLRASEVARLAGDGVGNILRKADAAGVTRRLATGPSGRPTAALVPETWADALLQGMFDREQGERNRAAGWVGVREAARRWGVGTSTILRGLSGVGVMASRLEGARAVRAKGGKNGGSWLIHPDDVAAVAQRLEAERALVRTLVSTKSIAVELGYNQGVVASLGTALGGRSLLSGGRLCCFVTPEQAAEIRRRLYADLPHPPPGWVGVSDLARQLGVSPSQVMSWARAKRRRVPLRQYRHPTTNQPCRWMSEDWAETYRASRTEAARAKDMDGNEIDFLLFITCGGETIIGGVGGHSVIGLEPSSPPLGNYEAEVSLEHIEAVCALLMDGTRTALAKPLAYNTYGMAAILSECVMRLHDALAEGDAEVFTNTAFTTLVNAGILAALCLDLAGEPLAEQRVLS